MTNSETTRSQPVSARPDGHRPPPVAVPCHDLWMIDHNGSTILRCRCLEASAVGMRLCVPAGYGVAVGHRYELCTHVAGVLPSPGPGVVTGRWGTVKRIETPVERHAERLDVLVALDSG